MVKPTDQPRERPARVRQVDFQLRKCIEHAAKDQRRRRDAGVVGIAEQVLEVIARRPLAADRVDRVQKNRPTQFFRLRVDIPKPPIIQIGVVDMRSEIHSMHPWQLGGAFEFLERKLGRLHR